MGRFLNEPSDFVTEITEGLALADDRLALIEGSTIVVRRDIALLKQEGRVALVSGGGGGHEPAHSGYVGSGMLSAAVSGPVFTSPSVDAVLQAILTVAGPGGVLLIVKNYTGDRLNFGLAAEIARDRGVQVEIAVVEDDVALARLPSSIGRRGIAGAVIVHKICGAAAEAGRSLQDVKALADQVNASLFSIGVGLTTCTLPGAHIQRVIGEDEVEFGLGIHGESGVNREPLQASDRLVDALISQLLEEAKIGSGHRVALMVNNLGATPPGEIAIVTRRALQRLTASDVRVERVLAGTFLTALDMKGCSLTLLRIDDELDSLLMAPAQAPTGFVATRPSLAVLRLAPVDVTEAAASDGSPFKNPVHVALFQEAVEALIAAVLEAEPYLTALDTVVGDGDLGSSLARGARAFASVRKNYRYPAHVLRLASSCVRREVGGTSGPLYAIFLIRLAKVLAGSDDPGALATWSAGFSAGCDAIGDLGDAKAGERTMLDSLLPAATEFHSCASEGVSFQGALSRAASAARDGANKTALMTPRRGRSSYIGARAIGHADPGAVAAALWLEALAKTSC